MVLCSESSVADLRLISAKFLAKTMDPSILESVTIMLLFDVTMFDTVKVEIMHITLKLNE